MNLDDLLVQPHPRYSICTLVTRMEEYHNMRASFRSHGFGELDCEFIYADNSEGNQYDGFSGYNAFLSAARGDYIILCHQDVLLLDDDRSALDARLAELAISDPFWAVCGNAGCSPSGHHVLRITDPHGQSTRLGSFPAPVLGLDENFVVVRRRANLGVTPHLKGFHLYASALCAAAASLGMRSYVIDFHLYHKSDGNRDQSFFDIRSEFLRRQSSRLRPSIIASTSYSIFISGLPMLDRIGNRLLRSRLRTLVFRLVQACSSAR